MSPKPSARRARREANPLHRSTERWEDLVAWFVGILVAASAGCAFLLGGVVTDSMSERSRSESADRTQVTATLLGDTGPELESESRTRTAPVVWTGRGDVERTAMAGLLGFHAAGATVPLWATEDGRLVSPPVTAGEATVFGVITGVVAALSTGAAVYLLGRVLFAWTGRRFARAWEQEWERVGPEWCGRARS